MKIARIRAPDYLFPIMPGYACIVRYGGIGDIIQATSVLPFLKKKYRVVFNTDQRGEELLHADPRIDELWVQRSGMVPNDELEAYWKRMAGCFEVFYNFSGRIEGELLAHPSRESYRWPKEKRHQEMNTNYLEHIHDIVGAPHKFHQAFFPTDKERDWARKQRAKLGLRNKVVMWSLSGSSGHKAYPFTDAVVANLMLSDCRVVMVGDPLCQVLEYGWQKERRIWRRSGKWSLRQTLSFAEVADVVVGTETGILNSVGFLPVPKVVLLSHSSKHNLTKHWVNTTTIEPFLCSCWPCHKLHYGWDTCNRDEATGGAMCAASIDPKDVMEAIQHFMR